LNRIATFRSRPRAVFAGARAAAAVGVAVWTLASGARSAAASSTGAPVVVVLPASGRGVSAAIVAGAHAVLVQSLGRPDRFPVVDDNGPPTAEPPSDAQAAAVALRMGARLAVSLDVAHEGGAGGSTTLVLACVDAAGGAPTRHMREMTTAGPEMLPDLIEWMVLRLQRALAQPRGAPVAEAALERAPAPASTPSQERMLTFGVRTSVVVPVASPARNVSGLGGVGALLSADAGSLLVDLGLDYVAGNDRHMASVGLGFFAPLGRQSYLPYAGGGVLWVDQRLGGRGASGLQLRPTVGLMWGRHEVIRARIEAAYFVDLFQELEPDRLFPGAGAGHVSHGITVALGATF
jgi:hypothetical protein